MKTPRWTLSLLAVPAAAAAIGIGMVAISAPTPAAPDTGRAPAQAARDDMVPDATAPDVGGLDTTVRDADGRDVGGLDTASRDDARPGASIADGGPAGARRASPELGLLPPQQAADLGSAPDLDLLWIARTPRYRWDQGQTGPAPGDRVVFEAHLRNAGSVASGGFAFRWRLDGRQVDSGWHASLGPGEEQVLRWAWSWQDRRHGVALELDADGDVREASELNNSLVVPSDALSLGIWVEESFHAFAATTVADAGWGGASFEDWLQRQVADWNALLAGAVHPLTPEGILDRVRLDRVVVVPDGALGCRVARPEADAEMDLLWGFPAAYVGAATDQDATGGDCALPPIYAQDQTLWDRDRTLLHELSHARSLPDLYGLNVRALEMTLVGDGLSATATRVPVAHVPSVPELQPPVALVVGGEIVRCAALDGLSYTDCRRGSDGTRARSHAPGTPVYAGGVLLTDGAGNALAGSAALPARADHFHTGPDYGRDLMNYGDAYGEHSAWTWNRIAGQRPRCGNHNGACDLGAVLSELPERTELRLVDATGRSLAGAEVSLHRPRPGTGWYARHFDATPDARLAADTQGRVTLGSQPFGAFGVIHDQGFSNGVLALRVRHGGRVAVTFVDAATLNLARARDGRQRATVELPITDWAERPSVGSGEGVGEGGGGSSDEGVSGS